MVKCIIFDCDGTLVDSEYHCNLGLEMMLRPYKVKSSASALMAKYRGEKLANILHSIEEEHNIVLEEHFVAEYRALVNTLFEKELNPCDGVIEFLNQNTIRSCVASSGPTKKINKALEITDLKNISVKIYLVLMKSTLGNLSLTYSFMRRKRWENPPIEVLS